MGGRGEKLKAGEMDETVNASEGKQGEGRETVGEECEGRRK